MIRSFSLIFVFLFIAYNSFADEKFAQQTKLAPQLTQQQKEFAEIFQKVILSDAPLSKELYDKFWNSVGLDTPAKRKGTVPQMRKGFMATQEYRMEVLKCAELILKGKSQNAKCPQAESKIKFIKSNSLGGEVDNNISIIEKNNNSLLESAISDPNNKAILESVMTSKKVTESMVKKMNKLFSAEYH